MNKTDNLKNVLANRPTAISYSLGTFILGVLALWMSNLVSNNYSSFAFEATILIIGLLFYIGIFRGLGFFRVTTYILQFFFILSSSIFIKNNYQLSNLLAFTAITSGLSSFFFLLSYKPPIWFKACKAVRCEKSSIAYESLLVPENFTSEQIEKFKEIIKNRPFTINILIVLYGIFLLFNLFMLYLNLTLPMLIATAATLLFFVGFMASISWLIETFFIMLHANLVGYIIGIIFFGSLMLVSPTYSSRLTAQASGMSLLITIILAALILALLRNKKIKSWRHALRAIKINKINLKVCKI